MAGNKIEAVQEYRFLLFLSVFLFHCAMNTFPMGWIGVQAFLVLSSFFVTRKLYYNRGNFSFKRELIHRIKRLYPAYLFVIVGVAFFYIIHTRKLPWDFPAYIVSGQNLYWILFESKPLSGILGHTWYITLDVYLFILAIFVFKITPPQRWLLISCLGIVASVVWRVSCNLYFDDRTISYMIPFGQMDSYCLGAILALNWMKGKTNIIYSVLDVSIGLLGVLGYLFYVGHTEKMGFLESYQYFGNSLNYTGSPLLVNIYFFVGLLAVGLLRFCLLNTNACFLKKWMVTLGDWSYELYLFHYPIIRILRNYIGNSYLLIALSLFLTICSAYLWHNFIQEKIIKVLVK